MNRYDCCLSYSRNDESFARQLMDYMITQGISVFDYDNIEIGFSFNEAISNAIRNCDIMVVLLSESSINSLYVKTEVMFAIETARNRNKQIIMVVLDNCELKGPLYYLGYYQCIKVNTKDSSWRESISPFLQSIILSKRKAFLYEELSEYEKNDLYLKASSVCTEIINIIISQISHLKPLRAQFDLVFELNRCLEQLHVYYDHCDGDYSKEARAVTQQKLDMLATLYDFTSQISDVNQDLFTVCCMIRMIYWDREIRWDCADMITHGEVGAGFVRALPESEYADKQSVYRSIYLSTDPTSIEEQSETVRLFITETEKYLYLNESKLRKKVAKKPTEKNERLEAIAKYIRDGNHIFELIGKDEKASAFIRCLITSYERLKNYCKEIGASELTSECIQRITILRDSLQRYEDENLEEHSTAEKSIRALLGFTRPGIGEYDAFLSHREYDTDIARTVYQYLKSQMKEVFFDSVSLSEELSDTDYKNAIFRALDKSKHFVVVITELKELEPGYQKHEKDWMQEEMDVFHSELIEGRKKNGNFLIIVTNEVYQQIVSANKLNIDLKWRRHSLIKLNEFKEQIIGYIK